jgi:hypothetical protein
LGEIEREPNWDALEWDKYDTSVKHYQVHTHAPPPANAASSTAAPLVPASGECIAHRSAVRRIARNSQQPCDALEMMKNKLLRGVMQGMLDKIDSERQANQARARSCVHRAHRAAAYE